jgi:hypothetical protein
MTWVLTAVGMVLVAAVVGSYLVPMLRRSRHTAPVYDHFNCPGCKRRLRFLPRQAGHRGRCPTCKRDLTFPVPAGPAFRRTAMIRGA